MFDMKYMSGWSIFPISPCLEHIPNIFRILSNISVVKSVFLSLQSVSNIIVICLAIEIMSIVKELEKKRNCPDDGSKKSIN